MPNADITLRYVVDNSDVGRAAAATEAAHQKMTDSVARQTQRASAAAEAAVEKALSGISDEERRLAAQVAASDAVFKARAQSLGLTAGQLRKLDKQMALHRAALEAEQRAIAQKEAKQAAAAAAALRAAEADRAAAAAASAAAGVADQHAQTLGRLRQRLADAAKAAERHKAAQEKASAGVAEGSSRAKEYGESTGRAAATTQNLQAQLFDIAQGLQGGQNPLTILAQQGPQVAQALAGAESATTALKAALASTLATIGPVVATVGAMYVAWRIYKEDADRAEETTTMVKAAMDAIKPSLDAAADATIRLRVATGQLTDEEGQLLTAATQAHRQYLAATEESRAKVAELRKEQGGLKTQLVDGVSAFLDVVDVAGVNSRIFDALTTDSSELQEQLDALTGAEDKQIEALRKQRTTTQDAIKAEDTRRKGVERLSEATKVLEERTKRLDAALRKQAERQRDDLAELLGLLVDAERAFADQREAAALAAEGFNGGLSPDTISRWRDLSVAVDEAVPPEALSRLDKLNLLLLDLQMEASRSARASDALAEEIGRVQDAIAEAEKQTIDWAAVFDRIASVAGAIGSAFSSLTGGNLDALLSPSGLVQAAGDSPESGGGTAVGTAAVDAAVAFVQAVVSELPRILDALISGLPRVFEALANGIGPLLISVAEKVPLLIAAIVEQVPSIVQAIAESIPTVIERLAQSIGPLIEAILAAVPEIILAIVDNIDEIVIALVEAVPVIAVALVEGIVFQLLPRLPEIAITLVKSLAVLVVNLATGAAAALVDLLFSAIPDFIREVVANLPKIIKKIASAGFDFAANAVQGLVQFFKDLIAEIKSLGRKKTKTFGDTPGPVKAGLQGLTAAFSPGDVVVAARDIEGVRRQVGATPESTGNGNAVRLPRNGQDIRPQVNVANAHRAFESLFVMSVNQGGTLATLRPARTGQRKVYGG